MPRSLQRCRDQLGRYGLPTKSLTYVKAGYRPDRRIVHSFGLPQSIEPRHSISRCDLAPTTAVSPSKPRRPGGGPHSTI